MRNKVMAVSAIAAGIVLASGGAAAADTETTAVKGGSGFSTSPVVVNEPQQGIAVVNGAVIDGRCIAPWSNGAVLAGTVAPNSHYATCNSAKVDQQQKAPYIGGFLF